MYHGYRFPPEIIGHAIWLYHRFCLSFCDIEDLLAERGVVVSYETIRSWCIKFGPAYARKIKKCRGALGDTWYMDEVYIVTVRGEKLYLWRAVDQDGDVLDILVQKRKDKQAAERFFRKLMKGQGRSAREIVTDKLPSYGAARKAVMSTSMHCNKRYANIGSKYRMSIRERRNDRCGDLNHPDRHSDFWLFTVRSITSFV